jgi:protein TonB
LKRHLGALVVMTAGSALVFGGVLAMNLFSEPPTRGETERAVGFEVEKKPPPPQQRRDRPQKATRTLKSSTARAAAPVPVIASQIAGMNFGLPQFSMDLTAAAAHSVLGDTAKSLVMTEESVDKRPEPIRKGTAVYPMAARKKGVEGSVTVTFLVNPDGRVSGIRVLNAEPPGVFEDAAKEALAQSEYRPAEYQGNPVTMRVKQTVVFKLQ